MSSPETTIRDRLYTAWWLVKLAAISIFNPEYVDKMVIMTGALREQALARRQGHT